MKKRIDKVTNLKYLIKSCLSTRWNRHW